MANSVIELADLSRNQSEQIFQTFWSSGLHGDNWPRQVFAVATFRHSRGGRVSRYVGTNTRNGSHAEENIFHFLTEEIQPLANLDVTLYVNYSPCGAVCVPLLVDLAVDYQVNLEIVVAALYKIRRPSCSQCRDHKLPSFRHHNQNVQGLNELADNDCEVRAFNRSGKQDWNTLAQILGVTPPRYKDSDREREDEDVDEDLRILLGEEENFFEPAFQRGSFVHQPASQFIVVETEPNDWEPSAITQPRIVPSLLHRSSTSRSSARGLRINIPNQGSDSSDATVLAPSLERNSVRASRKSTRSLRKKVNNQGGDGKDTGSQAIQDSSDVPADQCVVTISDGNESPQRKKKSCICSCAIL